MQKHAWSMERPIGPVSELIDRTAESQKQKAIIPKETKVPKETKTIPDREKIKENKENKENKQKEDKKEEDQSLPREPGVSSNPCSVPSEQYLKRLVDKIDLLEITVKNGSSDTFQKLEGVIAKKFDSFRSLESSILTLQKDFEDECLYTRSRFDKLEQKEPPPKPKWVCSQKTILLSLGSICSGSIYLIYNYLYSVSQYPMDYYNLPPALQAYT